ncbi:MAG: PhoH family protein [Deltaproteobacteria bacterium]|nr:PhoH family protein [Deltaproteobacteria bacterium]
MLNGSIALKPVDTILNLSAALLPNQFLILKNGRKSALGVYDSTTNKIRRVDKHTVYGITPRNAEQIFALEALLNRDIKLVTISGKAGTGKTLLALAAGLENHRYYRQMFLARPVVPLSNKDIGYLPGDIFQIDHPYLDMHSNGLSYLIGKMQGQKFFHPCKKGQSFNFCVFFRTSPLLFYQMDLVKQKLYPYFAWKQNFLCYCSYRK